MSLFRRKKKRNKSVEALLFNPSSLIRNIIYDGMLRNPEAVAVLVGLSPISEEVSEMEDRASEERLNRFAGLLPILENHSEIAGKVCAANYAISTEEGEDVSDEVIAAMSVMFKYVAFSATVSAVSQLIDLGLIEVSDGQ